MLRSSTAMLGAASLAELFRHVEQTIADGQSDGVPELVARIEQEFQQVSAALELAMTEERHARSA
jgi:hypothetical protein